MINDQPVTTKSQLGLLDIIPSFSLNIDCVCVVTARLCEQTLRMAGDWFHRRGRDTLSRQYINLISVRGPPKI